MCIRDSSCTALPAGLAHSLRRASESRGQLGRASAGGSDVLRGALCVLGSFAWSSTSGLWRAPGSLGALRRLPVNRERLSEGLQEAS
eukprot:7151932-Alexandrium_andersonii.AAC.1